MRAKARLCGVAAAIWIAGTPAVADTPPCTTNFGTGIVLAEYHGTVTPPADFATVTSDSATLWVLPDIRFGTQTLVIAAPLNDGVETQSTLTFKNTAGDTTHTCSVTSLAAIPDLDIATTVVGDCAFTVPLLIQGQTATFTTPLELNEVSSSPSLVLSALPTSSNTIEVEAVGVGTGHFVWLGPDTGNGILKGLCPITVGPAG